MLIGIMSTKKIFIFAIISLIIIASVVAVIFKFFILKDDEETEEVVKESYYYNVDQMICNLIDTSSIARLQIVIETTDKKLLEEFEKKKFLIKNAINEIIRNKQKEELNGSSGQLSLQKELVKRFQNIFNKEIINIYFEELIVQ